MAATIAAASSSVAAGCTAPTAIGAGVVVSLIGVLGWGGSAVAAAGRGPLQRDVAVLALGELLALRAEHLEAGDELDAGLGGVDDVVDEAALGGDVGVGELLGVLVDQLLAAGG